MMGEASQQARLEPCPFCGSEAYFMADNSYGTCGIGCSGGCNAEPYCDAPAGQPEMAAKAWNTRAPDPALLARIAELEAGLKPFSEAWKQAQSIADIQPMIVTARGWVVAEDFRRARTLVTKETPDA